MVTKRVNIRRRLDREISAIIRRSSRIDQKILSLKTNITYSDFLANKMLMILVIREGIPWSLFSLIQDYTPFTESDWADFLELSTKSLQRYKMSARQFKPIQSEKIVELAEATSAGLDVFGSMEKFKLWLDTPNFSLGNLKPIELLRDSYGKEMVMSELTRINYGILA